MSEFHILDNNVFPEKSIQFQTLESSVGHVGHDSPSNVSILSSIKGPLSPQGSNSCVSDPRQSPENTYGSPMSESSMAVNGSELKQRLRELEISLLGPEPDTYHISAPSCNMEDLIPRLDLKKVLTACAHAVSESDISETWRLMNFLERMVSVYGDPIQRLGAYMLEGLRARLESSGSSIYKSLKCDQPTSSELMSYMHLLYQICPYWKFAYVSANAVIQDAVKGESVIHIIDFQIAQGTQWMSLIDSLSVRPGGSPSMRITGIDDSQSAHARGGGLHIVGVRLSEFAESRNVPFEFYGAGMSGSEVDVKDLSLRSGDVLVVNFPFVLHHIPDESVTVANHRDRLLRLVRGLNPKVVTLVEQESNTNTSSFYPRFVETLDYYEAMLESIDAGCSREDKRRVSLEQNCVARDIVNIVACEGEERVERHELLGKWRLRFVMAGFIEVRIGDRVTNEVKEMLRDYDGKYWVEERNGSGVYLGSNCRALASFSAWTV